MACKSPLKNLTSFGLPFLFEKALLHTVKKYTTTAFPLTKYFGKTKLDCYILLSILQHTFHPTDLFFSFGGGIMLTVEFLYSYVEVTVLSFYLKQLRTACIKFKLSHILNQKKSQSSNLSMPVLWLQHKTRDLTSLGSQWGYWDYPAPQSHTKGVVADLLQETYTHLHSKTHHI